MTNAEKFKTAEERAKAFSAKCAVTKQKKQCEDALSCTECQFSWLDLKAEEEKVEDCPFCGRGCTVNHERKVVGCSNCSYTSITGWRKEDAITAHNRVARAVMEAAKCTS